MVGEGGVSQQQNNEEKIQKKKKIEKGHKQKNKRVGLPILQRGKVKSQCDNRYTQDTQVTLISPFSLPLFLYFFSSFSWNWFGWRASKAKKRRRRSINSDISWRVKKKKRHKISTEMNCTPSGGKLQVSIITRLGSFQGVSPFFFLTATTTTASWCAKQTRQTPILPRTYWNADTQTQLFVGFSISNNILGFVFGKLTNFFNNAKGLRAVLHQTHGKEFFSSAFFFPLKISFGFCFFFLLKWKCRAMEPTIFFMRCWATTMAYEPSDSSFWYNPCLPPSVFSNYNSHLLRVAQWKTKKKTWETDDIRSLLHFRTPLKIFSSFLSCWAELTLERCIF